jgi:hypothetical protein
VQCAVRTGDDVAQHVCLCGGPTHSVVVIVIVVAVVAVVVAVAFVAIVVVIHFDIRQG